MRRLIKSLLAYIFFALLSLAFFNQLFFPTLKIYYPADFSTSDLINVSLSLKHYLASSLAQNQLPFVSLKVGNGFPILAESQIGAFNLYNLFLYKFAPIIWAFNITYVLCMITMLSFGYLLGQYLWKRKTIALFFTIPLILVALAVCGLSAVQNNKNVLPADNQSKATNIESETSPRSAGNDDKSAPKNNRSDNTVAVTNQDAAAKKIWHLKFVPADVGDQDLDMIAVAGFTVIATEDGVNDISPEEMRQILDRVQAHNLKMIVDVVTIKE